MTHCRRGHEFTPETSQWLTNGRGKTCKICIRERIAARSQVVQL